MLLLAACRSSTQKLAPDIYPSGTPLLAVAEEHGDATEFWLLNPHDPAQRRRVATVQHRQDWGVRASVSPDGRTLAYAVLPKTSSDPDREAQLWTLPIGGRTARRLASGIDLRSDLVWSPDSRWVSYERITADGSEVRRVNLAGAGDQEIARSTADSRWYAMGYLPDGGAIVLARLTPSGTEVATQAMGGVAKDRLQVSSSASRGFSVGPSGLPTLLALQTAGGRAVYRALMEQADGSFARLTAGGDEDTGIAWNPRTGEPTVGVVPGPDGSQPMATPGARLDLAPSGFDVPVAWSPDGQFLALRHFTGASTEQPGAESIVLRGADEQRKNVTGSAPLDIAGWVLPGR